MPSEDISRSAFYASKRYRGVRMQQGRVLTDDDWNSQDDLAHDDVRWTRLHVIGPAGSPDEGFKIGAPISTGSEIDFELAAGTYYVSGQRVTLLEPIHFASQPDWIDMPPSERSAPSGDRTDFVYLEVWEQIVTAVEDEELFEKALGGPDTTTRRRLMARVKILAGVTVDDCEAAWSLLAAELAADELGTLDASGELISDLSLRVSYAESSAPDDLCTPSVTAGYLGAENQAVRVQLIDGQLVWGYDDAAPPYRATLDAAGAVLTFLSQPRDAAHWPLAGQTLEILRPVAALANGEQLADVKGHLTTLSASYDPTTRQVTLTTPHPDGAVLAGLDHVYVRMWRRGTDLASPPGVLVVPSTPIVLGNTGVTVTVEGTDLNADAYWVIAVRPETPDQVVPWELETGRKPNGIRRFYAPLGMLYWEAGAGRVPAATVEDCRPTFPPLTAQRGCCRYTVGDGVVSHGQFSRIQEAIDALPASGGEICLLAGTWQENVVISARHAVTIHGCGPRTVVGPRDAKLPTFLIVDSDQIRLEHFTVVHREFIAVLVMPPTRKRQSGEIALCDLDLVARDRSALVVLGVVGFSLLESRIHVEPLEVDIGSGDVGAWPAAFLVVREARVEHNRIETAIGSESRPNGLGRTALGGLQLGGQSRRVLVRGNVIVGGLGNGITLGSVRWSKPVVIALSERLKALGIAPRGLAAATHYVPPESHFATRAKAASPLDWASLGILFVPPYGVTDCCPELDPTPPGPPGADGDPLVPSSEGELRELRIEDNEIAGMGASGIGVARWWTVQDATFDMIHVDVLSIEHNRIRDCQLLPLSRSAAGAALRGAGGIALASSADLEIRDNHIDDNGSSHADPSCGVFLLLTEHLTFERNVLRNNGRELTPNDALKSGYRGGLVAVLVETGVSSNALGADEALRDDDRPAAKISDNQILSPDGPAIWLTALGSLLIADNQLAVVGRGATIAEGLAKVNGVDPAAPFNPYFYGQAVNLSNLGTTTDLGDLVSPYIALDLEVERIFSDGQVLFQHNQVRLDLRAAAVSVVTSSVGIISQDDINVDGNQLVVDSSSAEGDATYANLTAFAVTTRVTGNRMKERLGRALLSAYTLGYMNTTSDNHSTHCLLVLALAAARTASPNHSFSDVINPEACGRIDGFAEAASKALDAGRLRGLSLFGTEPKAGSTSPTFGAAASTRPVVARNPQYTLGLLE